MITFTVPAIPVAQPRQRTRVVNTGTKTFTQNYTPKGHPSHAFKASCRMAARDAYSGPPLDGALSIELVFILPRAQSDIRKTRPNPRYPHTKRPDFDNLAKGICDALSGLLWRDDSQLAAVTIHKFVAAGDEQPKVDVKLAQLSVETATSAVRNDGPMLFED